MSFGKHLTSLSNHLHSTPSDSSSFVPRIEGSCKDLDENHSTKKCMTRCKSLNRLKRTSFMPSRVFPKISDVACETDDNSSVADGNLSSSTASKSLHSCHSLSSLHGITSESLEPLKSHNLVTSHVPSHRVEHSHFETPARTIHPNFQCQANERKRINLRDWNPCLSVDSNSRQRTPLQQLNTTGESFKNLSLTSSSTFFDSVRSNNSVLSKQPATCGKLMSSSSSSVSYRQKMMDRPSLLPDRHLTLQTLPSNVSTHRSYAQTDHGKSPDFLEESKNQSTTEVSRSPERSLGDVNAENESSSIRHHTSTRQGFQTRLQSISESPIPSSSCNNHNISHQQQSHASEKTEDSGIGQGKRTFFSDNQSEVSKPSLPSHSKPHVRTDGVDGELICVNTEKYRLLRLLGKGGSSKVYEVWDSINKQSRAIKCVDLSEASEQEREAYMNEISILKKFQHETQRVVTLFDYEFISNENLLLIVMEKGETDLKSFIQSSTEPFDKNFIKYIWSTMLKVVKVIHDNNIVHSDLKPANFLLVNGKLKLIDFGIASSIQTDKTSVFKNCPLGTISYMSPEALQDINDNEENSEDEGKPKIRVTFKSDVWSLGCILYLLTYGSLPFSNFRNALKKMQAIIDDQHEIPFPEVTSNGGQVDANLIATLKRCLERDISKRASVDELLHHPYVLL